MYESRKTVGVDRWVWELFGMHNVSFSRHKLNTATYTDDTLNRAIDNNVKFGEHTRS